MGTILVLARESEDRHTAALAVGEAGFAAATVETLAQAREFLGENKAAAVVLVDSPSGVTAETLRNLQDAFPLLPVVAALKTHDAAQAIELLKAGAAEVLAPPWDRLAARAALTRAARAQATALALTPPKRPSSTFLYSVLGAAFLGALSMGTISYRSHLKRRALATATLSYDLPYRHVSSMAFDGKNLWVADWFTQSLYRHAPPELSVNRVAHFPSEMPAAISFFGESLWTVSTSGIVSQRMKDAQFSALRRFPEALEGTTSLAFDGLYLWTLDGANRLIVKRLADSDLTPLSTYRYPGLKPVAVAFDGHTLWSLDQAGHELIRHDLDRPDRATGRLVLPEYADGHLTPVALAWDGRHFWTAGENVPEGSGPAKLFRHGETLP